MVKLIIDYNTSLIKECIYSNDKYDWITVATYKYLQPINASMQTYKITCMNVSNGDIYDLTYPIQNTIIMKVE